MNKSIMSALEIAKEFINAINSGNANRLADLMTEKHTFIDSDGKKYSGREKMRSGWVDYYSMVPDYKIEIHDTFCKDNKVVFLGMAEGTFVDEGKLKSENHWRVAAAWHGVVENDKVSIWQVYVNPEPMVEIYNRIKKA